MYVPCEQLYVCTHLPWWTTHTFIHPQAREYTNTCTFTNTRVHKHTYLHKCMSTQTYVPPQVHEYTNICNFTSMYVDKHIYHQKQVSTQTHVPSQTLEYTNILCTSTSTKVHKHTYARTYLYVPINRYRVYQSFWLPLPFNLDNQRGFFTTSQKSDNTAILQWYGFLFPINHVYFRFHGIVDVITELIHRHEDAMTRRDERNFVSISEIVLDPVDGGALDPIFDRQPTAYLDLLNVDQDCTGGYYNLFGVQLVSRWLTSLCHFHGLIWWKSTVSQYRMNYV